MAWDKVTKIDSIAKRKPYTRVHTGMLEEYAGIFKDADAWRPVRKLTLTNKQRRAKNAALLGERTSVNGITKRFVGDACQQLGTSWPQGHKVQSSFRPR